MALATDRAASIAGLGADGFVSARDVLVLRRTVFADGVVSSDELDALFALGERAPKGDREWIDFFAEAASDYYLREEQPHGYLTEDEFRSLKARITRDGLRASELEIALLVRLMENAVSTPPEMSRFVAAQIKARIAGRAGGARLSADDASLIRRYLFAAGGDGNVAVTRAEAEFMFDLNDLVVDAKNDPAWTDLFVKAIVNHLMAHIGYRPVGRETALKRQAFFESETAGVAGVFARMLAGGLGGVKKGFAAKAPTAQAERNAAREAGVAEAERISAGEADWLADRIARDGRAHDSEQALIRRLKSLGADLPPKLKEIVRAA